jgi:hypothetical protein
MQVVSAPLLQFKCSSCHAVNQGQEHEFRPQNTMPPTWLADCGFCHLEQRVAPMALLAKAAAAYFP